MSDFICSIGCAELRLQLRMESDDFHQPHDHIICICAGYFSWYNTADARSRQIIRTFNDSIGRVLILTGMCASEAEVHRGRV